MSRGRSTSPGVTDLHAHICGGLKRSIKANPGTPMSILPGSVGSTCPWMDSVASGTLYTFQQDSAHPQGQTCAVLAEEECAQLLGLQHLAPQQPRPEPKQRNKVITIFRGVSIKK
ncbi:Transposable element tcb1 transposase [Caligus rogercresseyi]|uniref:Transposable element tcb1 transposase n=1 Tax=Caligus rogercresseyi TaxID=217165 RepID=A0A7T8GMV1_CALRO|nr:Transposable element tcb1 transposase [Caligus rogercresseyi]